MNGEIEVKGVILSSMPIGEYDKRVVILTDKLGKIHVFARGARRIHSKLLAGTEPLTFGSYKIFSGKQAYNLSEVAIIDFFADLKSDFELLCFGYYVLEFASYFAKENIEGKQMLRLIYVTLKALINSKEGQTKEFIKTVYEWKFFSLEGLMPDYRKGMVCGHSISETLKYTLNYIQNTEFERLFQFTLKEKEMEEFIKLGSLYHRLHIDKQFHSLEIITRGN